MYIKYTSPKFEYCIQIFDKNSSSIKKFLKKIVERGINIT